MALILSRVKRLFYIVPSAEGAFSKQMLHCFPGLNHHFPVYHIRSHELELKLKTI